MTRDPRPRRAVITLHPVFLATYAELQPLKQAAEALDADHLDDVLRMQILPGSMPISQWRALDNFVRALRKLNLALDDLGVEGNAIPSPHSKDRP
jgi:hypothetical protein